LHYEEDGPFQGSNVVVHRRREIKFVREIMMGFNAAVFKYTTGLTVNVVPLHPSIQTISRGAPQ
jgi:hypothetical protein